MGSSPMNSLPSSELMLILGAEWFSVTGKGDEALQLLKRILDGVPLTVEGGGSEESPC